MKRKISIVLLTILLVILRLININTYVSLACGFSLLYIILIGYSYILKEKLNKELCQTIPISIIGIVIIITIFGILNLLLPGAIILYTLGIISFLFEYIEDKFKILDIFKQKGMLFYTIIFVFLIIANYFIQFNVWDEYTYWSIASKNFYLSNVINFTKLNTMPFGVAIWYPTNPTIFQYFCMKLFGSYKQGYELFASQIMGFSLLLPLFKNLNSKKDKFLISIICLFIPAIFAESQFYYTIYVDCLLGLLTGYIIFEFLTNEDNKYKNLILIIGVVICALTKASGFMFSLSILIFYFSMFVINKILNKEKINIIVKDIFMHKMFYILFILTIGVFIGWRLYCSKTNPITNYKPLIENQSGGLNNIKYLFKSTIGAMVGFGYDERSEAIKSFPKNIFDNNIYTKMPIKLNVTSWIVIFIFLFIILYTKINDKKSKNILNIGISLAICFISYIFLLELSYLTMFDIGEAIYCNSSQRYMGSILLAVFIVIIGLYLYYFKNSKKFTTINLSIFAITLLFTPLDYVAQGTIFSGSRNYYSISYLRREKKIASIAVDNVKNGKDITVISQDGSSNSLLKVIYFATPLRINNTIVINKSNYDLINYDKILKNSKYILTIDIDNFIMKKVKNIYNVDLEPYTLYKIKNGNMIKIEKAIIEYEDSNTIGYLGGEE